MIPPRRFSARTVVGGLLAASIVGAGAALAVEHAGSGPASVSLLPAASSSSPTPGATPKPHAGMRGIGFPGLGGGFGMGAGQIIGILTKDTGLTPQAILGDIVKGQTLADIANANNPNKNANNADKVKQDALAAIKTGLDSAVTKGVFTQAQADSLLKDAGDAIDQIMQAHLDKAGLGAIGNHPPGAFPFPGGKHSEASPEPGEATPSPTPSSGV
jgi:hypothetical protein